jgi:hypothetical protein
MPSPANWLFVESIRLYLLAPGLLRQAKVTEGCVKELPSTGVTSVVG